MSAGLNSAIWDNNVRSVLLLGLYPFILMGLIWLCAAAVGYLGAPSQGDNAAVAVNFGNNVIAAYWPIILTVIAVWFVISYFFNTRLIARLGHASQVTRTQEPELYNLLENLCISEGVVMPKLYIIESHALNAYASGVDQKSYAVTVTRGLMRSLNKQELEAVLAHELTHIQNRDVRLMMVCVIFTGLVGFAAQLVWSNLRWSLYMPRGRTRRGGGNSVLIFLVIAGILWVGYMATLFTRFALSRRREFMADAGAVRMTKNPEAMINALLRISGRERIPGAPDDIMMMAFENGRPFMGLFATHPPIEKRVQVIADYSNISLPSPTRTAQENRFEQGKPHQNPWLTEARPRRNPWA